MRIKIEWDLTGPLSRPGIKRQLLELVDKTTTLREIALAIPKIKRGSLAVYRGGHHVAVHEAVKMSDGTVVLGATRFAIITEGEE